MLIKYTRSNKDQLKNTHYWLIFFGVFLLCLLLKLWHITSNEIALDEAFTIFHSNGSLEHISAMLKTENNPPFHFYFMHYWIQAFGVEPGMLRLPGTLAISLSASVLFAIGYYLKGWKTGILAGLLMCFSNFNVIFAHEVRVYPFFVLFTALSVLYFFKALNDTKTQYLVLWSLFNALLIYCHFFGFFVWIVQFVAILMYKQHIQLRWWLAYTGSLVLYIPVIGQLLTRTDESSGGTWIEGSPGFDTFYNILRKFSNAPVVAVAAIVLIIVGSVVYYKSKQPGKKELSALLIFTFLPLILLFIVSQFVPLFLDRYVVFVTVPYYLLLAFLASSMFSQKVKSFIVPGAVLLLFVVSHKPFLDNDRAVDEIAQKLETHMEQPSAKTIFMPDYMDIRLAYHTHLDEFLDTENFYSRFETAGLKGLVPNDNVSDFVSESDRVLLIDGNMSAVDPELKIYKQLLALYGEPVEIWETKAYRLIYFEPQK